MLNSERGLSNDTQLYTTKEQFSSTKHKNRKPQSNKTHRQIYTQIFISK